LLLVAFLLIRNEKKVIQPNNIELEIPFESLVRAVVKLDPQQKQQLLQILGGEVVTAGISEKENSLQASAKQNSQLSLRRPAATPSRGAGRDRNMRQLRSPSDYQIEDNAPLDEFML